MRTLSSLQDIIDDYEVFLLDLWGVIHDGISVYPNAKKTLEALKKYQKKVIFLSNAPRRATKVIQLLERLEIDSSLYDTVMSSGEVCFLRLQHFLKDHSSLPLTGTNYLYVGPVKDQGLLEGLSFNRVMDAAEANFLVATGFDEDDSVLEEKLPFLEAGIRYQLPLLCVNPDKIIVRRLTGKTALCAGVMADKYEEWGGEVIYYGKPHPEIYQEAFSLCASVSRERIVAIGDSIETDIKGATNQNMDAYLVTGGIHHEELTGKTIAEQEATINTISAFHQSKPPTGTIASFVW